ncbi:DUF4037 domain-containing protein [Micromonospora sp. DT81.3]|uniref:DUF4037 domain-containing protein n=1 Tax=Micromonospora sp. DT81.3 TaxID=3416523 RepID=UPI003CF7E4BC
MSGGNGVEVARAYYLEVVRPLLLERFPGMPHAAGRLGAGSDVLGLDDETSRDHDWGLRLNLLVPPGDVVAVDEELERSLPPEFRDLPVRFAFTGRSAQRHHVDVSSAHDFLIAHLGFDPRDGASPRDWLAVSGQAVLEVTAGPLFTDEIGEISAARRTLEWYPDDVWRYVLAADWIRLEQEMPLMGRAGDVGDERGSRIIAARLTQVVMHLAFLLERRFPPYPKWFGTLFDRLPCASELGPIIDRVQTAAGWQDRQSALAEGLQLLLRMQNDAGLTDIPNATIPFWDRPFLHPEPSIEASLLDAVSDEDVRGLPRGLGSIEQRTDLVDILVDPQERRRVIFP